MIISALGCRRVGRMMRSVFYDDGRMDPGLGSRYKVGKFGNTNTNTNTSHLDWIL